MLRASGFSSDFYFLTSAFLITPFLFNNIPVFYSYLLCFHRHSRFTAEFSAALLCFHRHSCVALSLFGITTVPSFAAKVAFCPGLRFGRRRPPTRTPLEGRRRSADGCRRWRGWGDLRKDTVPPGAGHGVNEERTSSGARLFTLVGYHSGGALSREICSQV